MLFESLFLFLRRDWTLDSSAPSTAPVFLSNVLGGDCQRSGNFDSNNWVPEDDTDCLEREFRSGSIISPPVLSQDLLTEGKEIHVFWVFLTLFF